MVWSSNTTASQNTTVELVDTGNLVVLKGSLKRVVWQSFDYPTDTILPGMKFGRDYLTGKEWYLSSWKTTTDPDPGEFSWHLDTNSYPQNLLQQGRLVKFRGPWNSLLFIRDSTLNRNVSFIYNNESAVAFSPILGNNSALWRFTLTSYGIIERSVWSENGQQWQVIFALPKDICDTYNICSAYASCRIEDSRTCACLDETRFVPRNKKDWEIADWTGGCVRRTPLDYKNGFDGFIKYSNVKLPDTRTSWFNRSMTVDECAVKCLENCSCVAYANTDIIFTGRGCLLWFNDLQDMRDVSKSNGGQDIFVRMASSELGFFFTWSRYAWRKRRNAKGWVQLRACESRVEDIQLPLFSFTQIANATASFSADNKLGEGGFGSVYKGVLEGQEIAVKRLSKTSTQGVDEFKNEVICISKLQHRNLVKLLGCCIQEDEKLLIYEYMPNKSLDSFIFDRSQRMLLDWMKRFNIINGIARGLLYLHQDSRLRIIHRDLKASNILLDQDMNPKILDFGLARYFEGNETHANTKRVMGTYGYMSPEYAIQGIFSIKSDVFSFGVLMLEIVSGQRSSNLIVHSQHENNLIGHAWSLYKEGRSMELIDASLAESCCPFEVLRTIEVGLLCVQQNARDRPNMSCVVKMLGGEDALPQIKQPAFFMESELLVSDFAPSTYNQTVSNNELTITELDAR
ncbi:hypothetical protein QVD17_06272 [Tagetes erecta]|uniref:non-specific serine/threonine protein kinase n=1 Tax=Tagetes erecta TaxID=13708 RepID=A0AAD8P679_TARER|nr:hypothetical protein QVD17_06272 [Tagetes erecta]